MTVAWFTGSLSWVRTLYKLEIHVHWAHSDEVSLAFASLISLKCVSMGIRLTSPGCTGPRFLPTARAPLGPLPQLCLCPPRGPRVMIAVQGLGGPGHR